MTLHRGTCNVSNIDDNRKKGKIKIEVFTPHTVREIWYIARR